ncbi:DUF4406 domain-containing protein [Pseudomonas sp. McL0111]|uniref:DUF4406 domain-containing protein n=1 Tax=Pseudomonas sp. McL0111 TaxID=3457357 RepID=UPI00403E90E1
MLTATQIDCSALRNNNPKSERVPREVRILKDVTADPMPSIGLAYFKGEVSVTKVGQFYLAWTNSHGTVAAVMTSGSHLGLCPAEVEVVSWYGLPPAAAQSGVTLQSDRKTVCTLQVLWLASRLQLPSLHQDDHRPAHPGLHGREPNRARVFDGAEWADYMAYDLPRLGLMVVNTHDLVTEELSQYQHPPTDVKSTVAISPKLGTSAKTCRSLALEQF